MTLVTFVDTEPMSPEVVEGLNLDPIDANPNAEVLQTMGELWLTGSVCFFDVQDLHLLTCRTVSRTPIANKVAMAAERLVPMASCEPV